MEDGPSTSKERSKELPQLKILEDQLTCFICSDYLRNPVMSTICSHNFCSYCIRNHLSYKASCPVCSATLSDNLLKANRCLEDIIVCFHPVKEYILKTGISEPSASKGKQLLKANNSNECIETEQLSKSSRSSRSSRSHSIAHGPQTDLNTTRKSTSCVPCPNCLDNFFQSQINSHLDTCLKTTPFQSRKPMPKLVYHLIKLAPLKKMLKDLGLSTTGDHATLANRHKKYTILYNSECDAANPRPVVELKAQLEEEEAETRRLKPSESIHLPKFSESTNLATNRTQASEAEIELANKKYILQHKESYDRLINDIRCRQQNVKTEVALNPQQSSTEVNKEEKNETEEDDDEIVVLETPVKIIETISLIESDEEASIPPETMPHSVSSADSLIQSNLSSSLDLISSISQSASSLMGNESPGTFSGGGDPDSSSSYYCPSPQTSINSSSSTESGPVLRSTRNYTASPEVSDGSLHSPVLYSDIEDIQMPALSYISESELSNSPTRIVRRSFEIISSEKEDSLPEPSDIIDSSSCMSASNSSFSNLHTSPPPYLVSLSASSSASPLSHSDSSLPLSQSVPKSRKRAIQAEVTNERKMSLRSRKM